MSTKCNIKNKINTFNDIKQKYMEAGMREEIVNDELTRSIILRDMLQNKNEEDSFKYAALIHNNKGMVEVYHDGSNEPTIHTVVDLKSNEDSTTITLDSGEKYTFKKNNSISNKTKTGATVSIPFMENINNYVKAQKKELEYDIVLPVESEIVFYSDGKLNTLSRGNYEEITDEVWNDPNKIKDIFETLVENDGIDNEHTKYLRDLLGKITDSTTPIFNEFKVYIANNAKKNAGVAKIGKDKSFLKLDLTNTTANSENAAQKVYMHELIHLSVEFARQYKKGKVSDTITKLSNLYEKASEEITIEKLSKYTTKEHAKKLYDQMFLGNNALAEFIALGSTEETVIEVLKTISMKSEIKGLPKNSSFFSHLIHYVYKLIDSIKNIVTQDGLDGNEALQEYVSKLWEHNSLTIKNETLYRKSVRKLSEGKKIANRTAVKAIAGVLSSIDKYTDKFILANKDNVFGQTVEVTKNILNIINPFQSTEKKRIINATLTELSKSLDSFMNLGWLIAPENTFNRLINYIKKDDELTTKLEKLSLITQKLDGDRQDLIVNVGSTIKSSFSDNLKSRKEQLLLTKVVIRTDLQSLLMSYSSDEIIKMLTDDNTLEEAIKAEYKNIDKEIKSEKIRNYYKSQANGLGYKLATGKSGSSVSKSAYEIVSMHNLPEKFKTLRMNAKQFKRTMQAVNRLSTLKALTHFNAKDKTKIASMDKEGLESVMAIHNTYVREAVRYAETSGSRVYPFKGDIKDTDEEGVDVRIGFDTKDVEKEMKENGYKKAGLTAVEGIAYYVNKNKNTNTFKKQAFAKINDSKRLHNIITLRKNLGNYYEEAYNSVLETKLEKEIERQMNNVVEPNIDGYIRVTNWEGKPTYGVSFDNDEYAKNTLQDNKAPILLGKMIAEIDEKKKSAKINAKVYAVMLKDAKNYKRKDKFNSGYIEIGPDAKTDGQTEENCSKELYNNLPFSIKKQIFKKKKGERYIAVRRDIASMYVGNRVPSILNLNIPFTGKTVEKILDTNKITKTIRTGLEIASTIWKDVVSLEKMDIVIRTPSVFKNNVLSNLNWSSVYGQTPWHTAAGQLHMLKETKSYRNRKSELDKLNLLIKINKLDKKEKEKTIKRIKVLKTLMKDSSVHPLFEAGLFTSIMSDVSDKDLLAASKLEKIAEQSDTVKKIIDKTPQIIKDGLSTIYMLEGTKMFDFLHEAMIYSDFVARAELFRFLIEEQNMSEKQAIKIVTEAFVNYNRNLPPLLQSLEVNGLEWFMQYTLGANKNLVTRMQEDPLSIMAVGLFLDAPNPTDSFAFTKDFGLMYRSPYDVATHGFMNNIATPSMFQIIDDLTPDDIVTPI